MKTETEIQKEISLTQDQINILELEHSEFIHERIVWRDALKWVLN